jgi:hypothetical protein
MMRIRKSRPERLRETVGDPLDAVRSGSNRSTVLKAALIAAGVAAVTAGSAAISSFRRRTEGDS